MQFTMPFCAESSQRLLFCEKIKATRCKHCKKSRTFKSHGFLYGVCVKSSGKAIRGLRFFCSNRYSNKGCGRSLSVFYNTCIPYHTVKSHHLVLILKLLQSGTTVHKAWYQSRLPFSSQTAAQWVNKFKLNLSQIRHKLYNLATEQIRKIRYSEQTVEMETLDLLETHFTDSDFIAQMQSKFQLPFLSRLNISS